MKDKSITITPKGITQKQFTNLVLELNIMRKAWRPYGVDINIQAPGIKKIIMWGNKSGAQLSDQDR
jgi:hypothetical protein